MKKLISESFTCAWSSLVKEDSLASQITSPINNKLGCF